MPLIRDIVGIGQQQYRWDDSMSPAYGLPTGGTAPTFVAVRGGNVFGYQFDGNDLLHGVIQLPHQLLPWFILDWGFREALK